MDLKETFKNNVINNDIFGTAILMGGINEMNAKDKKEFINIKVGDDTLLSLLIKKNDIDYLDMIEILITNGWDVNYKIKGKSLIDVALENKNVEFVNSLNDSGKLVSRDKGSKKYKRSTKKKSKKRIKIQTRKKRRKIQTRKKKYRKKHK
jgi:hypothetical protein